MRKGTYPTPDSLKAAYPKVSILSGERAVFNIGGNKYRLVARINYRSQTAFVEFVGTHGAYEALRLE
jgi:mRNA interferase HigB